eukprot:5063826-Pleurochrysis_carterae.AAC.1
MRVFDLKLEDKTLRLLPSTKGTKKVFVVGKSSGFDERRFPPYGSEQAVFLSVAAICEDHGASA